MGYWGKMAENQIIRWWAGNWSLAILWILNIVQIGIILWLWNDDAYLSDFDTLSVSITAVEIVLVVLTILLAIASFSGYWTIRKSAEDAARKEARQVVEALIGSEVSARLEAMGIQLGPRQLPFGQQDDDVPDFHVPDTQRGLQDIQDRAVEVEEDDGNTDNN